MSRIKSKRHQTSYQRPDFFRSELKINNIIRRNEQVIDVKLPNFSKIYTVTFLLGMPSMSLEICMVIVVVSLATFPTEVSHHSHFCCRL